MLRITVMQNGQVTRFRLDGKLKRDWVRELERCWIQARNEHPEMQFSVELNHAQ